MLSNLTFTVRSISLKYNDQQYLVGPLTVMNKENKCAEFRGSVDNFHLG